MAAATRTTGAERKVTVVLTETEADELAKLAEFADGPALDALNKIHDARRYTPPARRRSS